MRMKLRRVLNTGFSELVNRGWQEVQRSVDRMVVATRPNGAWPVGPFEHLSPQPISRKFQRVSHDKRTAADMALEAFLREGSSRFFAGAGDEGIPEFIGSRLPDVRAQIIAQADTARAHRFKLMGYHVSLDEADDLDWHSDAVSGLKSPRLHWSRINPLDRDSVGDSKVIWELSRHQWLVDLAQAYRLTGDERYAESVATEVRSWMHNNPPGIGINWASSLEVSFRLIAWCWALHLLKDSPMLSAQLYEDIRGWIGMHAAHVEKYLSHYFSPNTHLTGEALGLVYAGMLFPNFPKAERWRNKGTEVLLRQLHRQILPDGVYFEQSTCYARYTAEFYLHFIILAERNDMNVSSEVEALLCKLLDYLVAIRRPDGSLPQIGDADGGRLMPLAAREADDCRGVLALAATVFKRSDYAWAAGGVAPEVVWLLGKAGCEAFEALEPAPPQTSASRLFAQGGYAVMCSGWEADAHQLVMDTGPLGCSSSSGHGHADLLSVQCATFGKARLVDPGTYCYTAEPQWRDHFRGTHAHNTAVVDGENQAIPAGPFSWLGRPQARVRQWVSTPWFDFLDAEHDAYKRLSDPVVHRRRVLFVKPSYWILVDDFYGSDIHRAELLFQFGPWPMMLDPDGWAVCSGSDGCGLFLRPFASVDITARVSKADTDPIAGWVSPDYGVRVPAPLLVYSAECSFPLRIATLLLPKKAKKTVVPEVTLENELMYLDFPDGRETVHIDEEQIIVESQHGKRIEPLAYGR